MIATEIEPGVWRVVAQDEAERTSMRWLFTLSVQSPEVSASTPSRGGTFNNFAEMRASAAAHWESERAQGVVDAIFDTVEDPLLRVLGLRCRRTNLTWLVTIMAIREDVSGWHVMMMTPERRGLFATHPNFSKWARSQHPLDPCEGTKLDLKEGRFVAA